MPIDILSVISWIVEAWFLIIVLKWGARLLLGAIGVEPDRWIRRLRLMSFVRKKTQRDGRQIGRGSATWSDRSRMRGTRSCTPGAKTKPCVSPETL